MKNKHTLGRTTIQYYFSYNTIIPVLELSKSSSFDDAKELMKKYSNNIKYVFIRNKIGENIFIDCTLNPENDLCNPE